MSNEEKAILEKCGIHYENDTLEKEIALRVITETRKQFKEYLEKKIQAIKSMEDIDTVLPTDTAVVRTLTEIINEFLGNNYGTR